MTAAGEPLTVQQLVADHLPALEAFVRLRMGRELRAREESCDLVQSVAREVLRNADRFQHGGEQGFRDWLLTTAHRKVVNRLEHWRAHKRSAKFERDGEAAEDLPAPGRSPSELAVLGEEFAEAKAAIGTLSDEQRDVLVLSRLVGLSHAEIASRIGKSEVAVRKTLSRAMARLAAVLAGESPRSATTGPAPAIGAGSRDASGVQSAGTTHTSRRSADRGPL